MWKITKKNFGVEVLNERLYNILKHKKRYGMMKMKTVKINVAGVPYNIATDNDPEYVLALAEDINSQIHKLMATGNVAPTQAMVLTLLNYADEAKKSVSEVDKVRTQLGEYLADAAQAKSERDMLKREIAKMKKGNQGDN